MAGARTPCGGKHRPGFGLGLWVEATAEREQASLDQAGSGPTPSSTPLMGAPFAVIKGRAT